jgi:NTP pyrophosphatase (non-canonical NTP hydrolase)
MRAMPRVAPGTSIREFQGFIREVYGLPNERHFSLWDMLSNVERFAMRSLKGIRKQDPQKAKANILISFSWFISVLNRLHIDLEDAAWNRFPAVCSYCATSPCSCREKHIVARQNASPDHSQKPASLDGFQVMFSRIYPPEKRTPEHAGIHLAEELGEFSEALLTYRGGHNDAAFAEVVSEAADVFSCLIGLCNSLGIRLADELSLFYSDGCHYCRRSPCACSFATIMTYES